MYAGHATLQAGAASLSEAERDYSKHRSRRRGFARTEFGREF